MEIFIKFGNRIQRLSYYAPFFDTPVSNFISVLNNFPKVVCPRERFFFTTRWAKLGRTEGLSFDYYM